MQTKMIAALIAMTASAPLMAEQPDGDWMIRARVVNIDTANKSDAIPALGVAADEIHVSSKAIPELDISYFFTKNIAAELVLTYPQEHNVSVAGTKIGTVRELPPTLLLQYHFMPDAQFRPYVGAGINYTRFSSIDLNVPGVGDLEVDKDSFGLALQVGMDVQLSKQWFFNVDLKKVKMGTDVKLAGGGKVSSIDIDPWLFGVGIGYRF